MKPLTIERVKGQRKEFTFLGWKDDGLAFYATASDGQPAVIVPASAYPSDSNTGEPYRFPRMIPLGIMPKQFNIAWSDHHRVVLRRWVEAKLADVDAETQETLFPSDVLKEPRPVRSLEAINRRRQEIKNVINHRFEELMKTPLVELLDPIAFPYLLEDFQRGRWADEMGEDFGVMMNKAWEFSNRWHHAYDPYGERRFYQEMLSALCSVRFVMRGDDQRDYPLTGVDVRMPTDQEARAYAVMKQILQGSSGPCQPASGSGATTVVQAEAVTRPGLKTFKEVCKHLGCKPATLRGYCENLGINSEAITAADLAQIKDYREERKRRPHLKEFHGARHGPKPNRRGNQGA